MPIIMSRGGAVLSAPTIPQEQSDKAWESLVRAWAKKHPEALKQAQAGPAADPEPTRAAAAERAV